MRITEQLVKRVILGLFGGALWLLILFSVLTGASGSDYLFAAVVGNAAGVLVADRWLRWMRGGGVFIAAEAFGIGAVLLWTLTPWQTNRWEGTGILTFVLGVATVALWWAVHGYRYDEPPAPASRRIGLWELSPRAERWVNGVLILIIAAVLCYKFFVR